MLKTSNHKTQLILNESKMTRDLFDCQRDCFHDDNITLYFLPLSLSSYFNVNPTYVYFKAYFDFFTMTLLTALDVSFFCIYQSGFVGLRINIFVTQRHYVAAYLYRTVTKFRRSFSI